MDKSVGYNLRNIFLIGIIFAILFVQSYISREHQIYYWDFDNYFSTWKNLGYLFDNNFGKFRIELLNSVRYSDYNSSILLPLMPFYFLFSGSRVGYVTGITLVYFIPFVYLFARFAKDCLGIEKKTVAIVFLLTCLTFSPFWRTILRGFPDIAGLIFVLILTIICTKYDLSKKVELKLTLIIGLNLWLIFFFRRWYAYTIISLSISLPLLNYFLFNKTLNFERLFHLFKNCFLILIFSSVSVVIFQYPLIRKILETDYSTIYSGYQTSFIDSVTRSSQFIGYGFIFSTLIILLFTIRIQNKKQKLLICFCIFNLLFTFLAFTRTQSPGMHHVLPFALWLLLVFNISFSSLIFLLRKESIRKIAIYSVLLLSFSTLLTCISNYHLTSYIKKLLPLNFPPLHLKTIQQYNSLVQDLIKLTEDGSKLSVLSSSSILNKGIINSLSGYKLGESIERTSEVDLRDKFKFSPFLAKYLVVTDPIQTHLRKGSQTVVSIPAKDILEGKGIGRAYKKLGKTYHLENGVKAYIFEKERNFNKTEIDSLLNQFYLRYPSWKDEYRNIQLYSH